MLRYSRFSTGQLCPPCLANPVRCSMILEVRRNYVKHLSKYEVKVQSAESEWNEKAKRIQAGEEKHVWDILQERGLVKDTAGKPNLIRELMRRKRISAYTGIDPTASSLHVGHLLPLMPLIWMYAHGFGAFTLIGGATGKIGDPTGRLNTREKMVSDELQKNVANIHYQLKSLWKSAEKHLQRHCGWQREWASRRGIINNREWWHSETWLFVLQRVGANLRMGPLLSRDTVKNKLDKGDGMSFAEFTYPLMQGWDWWRLQGRHNIQMQIGGSDQFGNIATGVDIYKAARDGEPDPQKRLKACMDNDPVGFTVPLLTDKSGAKLGKSAGNAIWLDPFQTSLFDFYGYFVGRPDDSVQQFLKLLTLLPMDVIAKAMQEHSVDPSKRVAQHLLAFEVTHLVHGPLKAEEARSAHKARFGQDGTAKSDSPPIAEKEFLPSERAEALNRPRTDLKLPMSLFTEGKISRIVYAAGFANSLSEANRMVMNQALWIGGAPGQKPNLNKGLIEGMMQWTPIKLIFKQDLPNFIVNDKFMFLRKGKFNMRIIEIVSDEEYRDSGETYPGQERKGRHRRLAELVSLLRQGKVEDANAAEVLMREIVTDGLPEKWRGTLHEHNTLEEWMNSRVGREQSFLGRNELVQECRELIIAERRKQRERRKPAQQASG